MYGPNTGNLRVWIQPQNGSNFKVWDLQGDKGATWLQGRTTFSSKVPFYVGFIYLLMLVVNFNVMDVLLLLVVYINCVKEKN